MTSLPAVHEMTTTVGARHPGDRSAPAIGAVQVLVANEAVAVVAQGGTPVVAQEVAAGRSAMAGVPPVQAPGAVSAVAATKGPIVVPTAVLVAVPSGRASGEAVPC